MRVRCISDYVTPEQGTALGRVSYQGWIDKRLTIGMEYLVLGLRFEFDPRHFKTGPSVLIVPPNGVIASCDLGLFEITDPRASSYWLVRTSQFYSRQRVKLMPLELFEHLDDVENDPRSMNEQDDMFFAYLGSDEFKRICSLLENEYAKQES